MKKKVCIIFPANYREFTRPCIQAGKMLGYLEARGISADIYDLNIQWIRYLLSPEGIRALKRVCGEQFALLEEKEELSGAEQKKYETLAWISRISAADLLAEAEDCVRIFKSERFYCLSDLNRANRFLTELCRAADFTISREGCPAFYSWRFIEDSYEKQEIRSAFYRTRKIPWEQYEWFVIPLASEAQLLDAFYFCRYVKERSGKAKCVLSGHPVSILQEEFLKKPEIFRYADLAAYGETEPAVYHALCEDRELSAIPNLLYKGGDGRIHRNPQSQCEILDGSISYRGINWELYLSPVRCAEFSVSFGCVWAKCSFCNLHKSALHYTVRDLCAAAENLIRIREECHAGLFCFTDEALTAEVMDRLAEELLLRKAEVEWTAQTRFDPQADQRLFSKIAEAGCRHLEFGLESADETVQKHMKKGISNQTARRNFADARRAGILTTLNLITGYPCPEDFSKTVQFIKENAEFIDRINNFAYYVTKGSQLQDRQELYGILVNCDEENDLQITFSDYTAEKGLSRSEIEERVFAVDEMVRNPEYHLEASLCPILEYSAYYRTTNPQKIMERADKRKRYEMLEAGDLVRVRRGVVKARLRFDLIRIRRNFFRSVVWTERAARMQKLPACGNGVFLFDTLRNIVYRPSEALLWLADRLTEGPLLFEELASGYAQRFHVSEDFGRSYLNRLNMIYRIMTKDSQEGEEL